VTPGTAGRGQSIPAAARIGGRLALGLAAVSAVIVWGHILASRTTRIAVESVRSMQTEHEPLAQRAGDVWRRPDGLRRGWSSNICRAAAAQGSAASRLPATRSMLRFSPTFNGPQINRRPLRPPGAQLLPQLTSHNGSMADLARHASQRAEWLEQRYAALDRVQQRINSAGGAGLAINGSQVVATRSLSELASAIMRFGAASRRHRASHNASTSLSQRWKPQRRAPALTRAQLAGSRETGLRTGHQTAPGHRQIRRNQRRRAASVSGRERGSHRRSAAVPAGARAARADGRSFSSRDFR